MKILITGASGFVGSHLVRHALTQGFTTFAGVRLTSNLSQFDDLPLLTFLQLPYNDKSELKAYLLSCKEKFGTMDYIIHNAGLTKCQQKSDFDKVNYEYTRNFVEALIEADYVPQKFIYISSLSAVGPGNENTLESLKATDTPHPDTLYGLSKLKAEQFLETTVGFPFIIVRPTGIYGPGDKDYTLYISTIDKGIEPYLGFKPQYISFIYINDLMKAIFSMLDGSVQRKAYFVSDGKSYTQQEYAGIIKKHLHKKTIKITLPLFLVKALCYGLDKVGGWLGRVPTLNADKYKIMSCRNWVCDISDLTTDFDFKPDYYLEDGVKETIAWYLLQNK